METGCEDLGAPEKEMLFQVDVAKRASQLRDAGDPVPPPQSGTFMRGRELE